MNQEMFQNHVETFEKFVNDAVSGMDQNQKSLFLEKCQDFVSFCNESKKRPLEHTKLISKEKKIKIEIPDEIWLKIIGFMDAEDVFSRFALVCKRFKSLTSDPTAIKRLFINHRNVQKKDSPNFRKLLKRKKTMVEFTLVKACLKTAINVTKIVLKSNPKLKSLKILNHLNCKCIYQMDKLVECIKTYRPDLENLELNFVDYYDLQAMIGICTLKNLKSLKISNHKGILVPEYIYYLAINCEDLENISLSESESPYKDYHKIGAAWNHLLGQRSTSLKSIYMNIDLTYSHYSSHHFIELENLKLCQNLEEISIRFDKHHLTMIPELPKLKKLVLFGYLSAEDLIPCFQSMNLSSLKYLSFRNFRELHEESFWTKFAMIQFPVLERVYFHPNWKNYPSLKQKHLQNLLNNCPQLKSIQFSGKLGNNLSNKFLFDIFKMSNVLVIFRDSFKQFEMEDYFKNRNVSLYEKYQLMKKEFSKWCENTDF